MSGKPLGIGVVGLGFMGATHVTAYENARRDGAPCRLVAVCDRDAARRSGRAATASGNIETGTDERLFDPEEVHGFDTVDALLECDEVDLVSVCTPTDSHVPLGIRILESGRHLLMEKPVAVRADDAEPLAAAAATSASRAMPALCMRFWPGWSWLLDRTADGSLGMVRAAAFQRLSPAPTWAPGFYDDPERSGGALVDLHVHDADFVRALLGEPDAVSSTGTLDHVSTHYHFDDGPGPVSAVGGWGHADGFPFRMRYIVDFEDGTAEFDSLRPNPLTLTRDGETEDVEIPDGNGYDGEIRHFLRVVAGEEPLAVTIEDAVATARLLDRERRSLESGGRRI